MKISINLSGCLAILRSIKRNLVVVSSLLSSIGKVDPWESKNKMAPRFPWFMVYHLTIPPPMQLPLIAGERFQLDEIFKANHWVEVKKI